ncbi:hypothetical protein CK203_082265 [Vitis vinifera]|uniref:Uncharacterized protein n=1 Tax=Vitis vinifera TaxID=29760 RepID=A0A438EQJ8_VITVI|nr:hypothetical protein CK203_082265 [Vitis vinifera]
MLGVRVPFAMAAELGLVSLTQLQKLAQSQQHQRPEEENPSSTSSSWMWNPKQAQTQAQAQAQEDDDSWEKGIPFCPSPRRSHECAPPRPSEAPPNPPGYHLTLMPSSPPTSINSCMDSPSTLLSIAPYPPNNLISPCPPSINFSAPPQGIALCPSSKPEPSAVSNGDDDNENTSNNYNDSAMEELDLELRLGHRPSPS